MIAKGVGGGPLLLFFLPFYTCTLETIFCCFCIFLEFPLSSLTLELKIEFKIVESQIKVPYVHFDSDPEDMYKLM